MPDRYDPLEDVSTSMARHAGEWGLASLVLGGLIVIVAPITLIFNLLLWMGRQQAVPPEHMRLAYSGALAALIVVFVLGIVGLVFGVRGLVSAAVRRQPAGLAVGGVIVNAAALLLWLIVSIDQIMIWEGMLRMFRR
jgi:hypothetical protein